MECSIRGCNNPAIDIIDLENGEERGFCWKNSIHTSRVWLKKRQDYQENKEAIKHHYQENKERILARQRPYSKQYYYDHKERILARKKKYYPDHKKPKGKRKRKPKGKRKRKPVPVHILKERARKHYLKNREKEILRGKEYRKGLKIINLSYRNYRQFAKSLILARDNQCERCSSTNKRVLVHHRKEPYLFPHLITVLSNCFVLCYSCHKIIHTYSKERLKFYFQFI